MILLIVGFSSRHEISLPIKVKITLEKIKIEWLRKVQKERSNTGEQ